MMLTVVRREDVFGALELRWYRGQTLLSRLVLSQRYLVSGDLSSGFDSALWDDNGLVMDA